MIKITRTEKPNVLVQNAESWTVEYLEAKAIYENERTLENKRKLRAIEKRYNQDEVKSSLKVMFNKKCALCESHITHVDYGQIEHFKPKSKYPEFCFDWDNFLLACTICNGKSNKGDKFPLEDNDGPFVNPVEEIPDDFLKFEYDEITKQFFVFPKNKRAFVTIKELGLNRDELLEYRTKELSKITYILEKVIDTNQVDILENFINEFSEKDQYYAFIKAVFEKIKKNNTK